MKDSQTHTYTGTHTYMFVFKIWKTVIKFFSFIYWKGGKRDEGKKLDF